MSFSLCTRGRKHGLLTTGSLFDAAKTFPECLTIVRLNPPYLSHLVAHAGSLLTSKLNTALPHTLPKIDGRESYLWLQRGAGSLWAPSSVRNPSENTKARGWKRLGVKSHLPLHLAGCYTPPGDSQGAGVRSLGRCWDPCTPVGATWLGPSPRTWPPKGESSRVGKIIPRTSPEIIF